MAYYTPITAATTAVTNRFVASVNMANGAYTIANASPAFAGGVQVVATITAVGAADTPGTITIVGTDIKGNALTETVTLAAGGTATSVGVFRTITSITQAGWVINAGNDTIIIGHTAGSCVGGNSTKLLGVIVNTTAASAVVISDSRGTIATLKASIAEGVYLYGPDGIDCTTFCKVATTGANDITLITSGP